MQGYSVYLGCILYCFACVCPMSCKAGYVHCKYCQIWQPGMRSCKRNPCTSTSHFFPLQRRLREAVQLLEDYKHGTLRPGVTNEQVTDIGGQGRQVLVSLLLLHLSAVSIQFFCCIPGKKFLLEGCCCFSSSQYLVGSTEKPMTGGVLRVYSWLFAL